jgi:polysaccharide export outer membrane protein
MTFFRISVLAALALLGGCATLPSSGPTGSQIVRSARDPKTGTEIKVIPLTDYSALPPAKADAGPLLAALEPPPTDMVGPGDVLDISIYEAGVTLFSGNNRSGPESAAFDPSVKVERLPAMRVDDAGRIQLPYTGRLNVSGRTIAEIETMIRNSLRGLSQNPQVVVTIREAITNSVIIGGEVIRPGRLVLQTNRESLSDVVALAGGYRGDAKEMNVRVLRRNQNYDFRLSDLLNGPDRDLRAYPGDRITVVRSPRSFAVMGGSGRVEQLAFSGPSISLAEAIAMAGGANPNLGDPQAIFVFRITVNADGTEEPVVYHLNMSNTGGFFVAQRFAMQDKDVLYFGNARANQPSKLIQIISQLFAPIVTIRDIARSAN